MTTNSDLSVFCYWLSLGAGRGNDSPRRLFPCPSAKPPTSQLSAPAPCTYPWTSHPLTGDLGKGVVKTYKIIIAPGVCSLRPPSSTENQEQTAQVFSCSTLLARLLRIQKLTSFPINVCITPLPLCQAAVASCEAHSSPSRCRFPQAHRSAQLHALTPCPV